MTSRSIPTKNQFDELAAICQTRRLEPAIGLISNNIPEPRLRGILKGFENTLEDTQNNHIDLSPAFRWLSPQSAYQYALKKAFPTNNENWIDIEIKWIFEQAEKCVLNFDVTSKNSKAVFQGIVRQVGKRIQLKNYWLGLIASSLSRYHYPVNQNLGKMRDEMSHTAQCITDLLNQFAKLDGYNDYMPWLNLPDQDLTSKLTLYQELLSPGAIQELVPIRRGDKTLMERLFVVQMADGHAQLFNKDDGLPSVITELFYLDGFNNKIDERNIRAICQQQRDRRSKAMVRESLAWQSANVVRMVKTR